MDGVVGCASAFLLGANHGSAHLRKNELPGKCWFISWFRSQRPRTRECNAARTASNRGARVAASEALPARNAGTISGPSRGTVGSKINCAEPRFSAHHRPHDRARDERTDRRKLAAYGMVQVYRTYRRGWNQDQSFRSACLLLLS